MERDLILGSKALWIRGQVGRKLLILGSGTDMSSARNSIFCRTRRRMMTSSRSRPAALPSR